MDMLQLLLYLYVDYLIIFLTSALLTRSAIHLIINAWISAKTRQKKERGHVNCGRVYRDKKEWRQDPDAEHTL